MLRTLALAIVFAAVSLGSFLALAGRSPASADTATAKGNLELELPESSDPPDYAPERIASLTVDGKTIKLSDAKTFEVADGTKKTVTAEPKAGKDGVTVVYTFWPNTYTKIIRTKVVKLEKGKLTKASLLKEDKSTPDMIRPIYVPTPNGVVRAMCKMAKIGKDDVVWDIGCGDGRLVIMAVKEFGAKKAHGVDINADLVKKCKENAKAAGVSDKVSFEAKDCQKIKDFSEASVVLLYLGDFLNKSIKPDLLKTLKPGARVVSHRFKMGKDWEPDQTITINEKDNYDEVEEFKLHLWTIKKKGATKKD